MKTVAVALMAMALLAPPPAAGQDESDFETLLRDFGSVLRDGGVTVMLIHLNDTTVDALFEPPTKYSLRAQARQASIFYVQGTTDRDLQPDDWQARQESRVIGARTISLSNFEPGLLPAGTQFTGLIVLDQPVNLRAEFTVQYGDQYYFDFLFSPSAVARIQAR